MTMIDLLARRMAMMAEVGGNVDDGLFAYWNGTDAPTDTTWTDRINGIKITLANASMWSDNKYTIVNTQWMKMKEDISGFIDYELMVEIGYDVYLSDSSRSSYKALDFGAIGTAKWNYAFKLGCKYDDGQVVVGSKDKNNQALAEDIGYDVSFSKNTWVNNQVAKGGIRLLKSGYQQVWGRINNSTETHTTGNLTATKLVPVPLISASSNGYFNVGSGASAVSYNEQMVVHYIKLYNKSI